ncbi:hypothetical protein B5F40_00365 [Gordonibacter sp. An230]|uniref:BspA family leucine-rich repeat surface protein n=1 Tax=Gordonibacter sp. An230 TaxID=1965592 RepID=UPI000B373D58|nr:BspA family leucine-rich repeat surface protein [Gordonibacter sp. An230]OUO92395.1 hypothetical protein B5F40_00365 [Gordonibacter sp. An230]
MPAFRKATAVALSVVLALGFVPAQALAKIDVGGGVLASFNESPSETPAVNSDLQDGTEVDSAPEGGDAATGKDTPLFPDGEDAAEEVPSSAAQGQQDAIQGGGAIDPVEERSLQSAGASEAQSAVEPDVGSEEVIAKSDSRIDELKCEFEDGHLIIKGGRWRGVWPVVFDEGQVLSITIEDTVTSGTGNFDYLFAGFSSLTRIEGLENLDMNSAYSCTSMFQECEALTSVKGVEDWDVSNVTRMDAMFKGDLALESLEPLRKWDVSNVTNMIEMFSGCSSVTSLEPLRKWDVSNVTDMNVMFSGCSSVTSLEPLGEWDVSNVQLLNDMFDRCTALTSLEGLEKWKVQNVISAHRLFNGCTGLTSAEHIADWKMPNNPTMLNFFNNCYSLERVSLSMNLEKNVGNHEGFFSGCKSLWMVEVGEGGVAFPSDAADIGLSGLWARGADADAAYDSFEVLDANGIAGLPDQSGTWVRVPDITSYEVSGLSDPSEGTELDRDVAVSVKQRSFQSASQLNDSQQNDSTLWHGPDPVVESVEWHVGGIDGELVPEGEPADASKSYTARIKISIPASTAEKERTNVTLDGAQADYVIEGRSILITRSFPATAADVDVTLDIFDEIVSVSGDVAAPSDISVEGLPMGVEPDWKFNGKDGWFFSLAPALDSDEWKAQGDVHHDLSLSGIGNSGKLWSQDLAVHGRPAAPQTVCTPAVGSASGDPGEGSISLPDDQQGRTYQFREVGNGSWAEWPKEVVSVAAGSYEARVTPVQVDDHVGWAASVPASAEVSQIWPVSLSFVDVATDEPLGTEPVGVLRDDGSVSYDGKPSDGLVTEGLGSKLPVFFEGEGTFEVPGYDIVRIEWNIQEGESRILEGDDLTEALAGAGPAADGPVEAKYYLKERRYDVSWIVNFDKSSTDGEEPKGSVDPGIPSVQSVGWTEETRCELLVDLKGSSSYWNPDDPTWVEKYFPDLEPGDKPIDPTEISWGSYVRDPWVLHLADGTTRPFQVASSLSVIAEGGISPADFGTSSTGEAVTWRTMDGLSFSATYRQAVGVYAGRFSIPEEYSAPDSDGRYGPLKNGNGNNSRTSALDPGASFGEPPIFDAGGSAPDAQGLFRSSALVFSGYYFDVNEKYDLDGDEGAERRWAETDSSGPVTVEDNLAAAYGELVDYDPDSFKGRRPIYMDSKEGAGLTGDQIAEIKPEALFSLTARIEDAGLKSSLSLDAPAIEEGGALDGVLSLSARDLFDSASVSGASSVSFEVGQPSFTPDKGDGSWLRAYVANDGYIGTAQDSAMVSLSVRGLKQGSYGGTLTVPYTYTDSIGRTHNLSLEQRIELDVYPAGAVTVADGWAVAAHPYATTTAMASLELADDAGLAKACGLTVWKENGDAWDVQAADSYSFSAEPSSLAGAAAGVHAVRFDVVPGTETASLSAAADISLFDGGEPNLFFNDAAVTLPEKDAEAALGDAALGVWLAAETGAKAFNPAENWAEVPVVVSDPSNVRDAGPDAVGGQASFEAYSVAGGPAHTASISFVKAPLPAAPVPGSQDASVTTDTSLAVGAASWREALPEGWAGAAESGGYAPGLSYSCVPSSGSRAESGSPAFEGLEPNSRHEVSASWTLTDEAAQVWEAPVEPSEPVVAWTRPSAPESSALPADGLDASFDLTAGTLVLSGGQQGGAGYATVARAADGSELSDGSAVLGLAGEQLSIVRVGSESGLESESVGLAVPERFAVPAPSLFEPQGSDGPAYLVGFDPATAAAGLYLARVDGGAWEPVAVSADGTLEVTRGHSWEFMIAGGVVDGVPRFSSETSVSVAVPGATDPNEPTDPGEPTNPGGSNGQGGQGSQEDGSTNSGDSDAQEVQGGGQAQAALVRTSDSAAPAASLAASVAVAAFVGMIAATWTSLRRRGGEK